MAEVVEVTVPDIGDFADVPVIEILVKPGQEVAPEDPLVTLESDKATMDVPSPQAGTVQEIKVELGDRVSQGAVLLTLAPAAEAVRTEGTVPSVRTEGTVPSVRETAPAPEKAATAAPPATGDSPYASPTVRRYARELGVDLASVKGTGRKGRITRADVEAAGSGAPSGAEGPASGGAAIPGLDLAPWPTVDFEKYGPVERVPLSRIKRISGPNLARNWVMIPHVTHHDEADITDLEAFRKQVNAEQDIKLTMVALLLKACIPALKEFPELNASLAGEEFVLKRYYHLGFAADTPQGLVVPVIRDVDRKGLLEIASELKTLSGKAREGKLMPADMAGGTFTISSLGGIGGTGFTPIVNAPEVAILGVTRSAIKPVWNGSAFKPRLMVPLSLSYDHRVIDGALAARFTAHLAGVLSDFKKMLL